MTLIKTGGGLTDIRGGFGGVYFHRDKSGLHSSAKPRTVHRRSAAQDLQRKAFTAARALSKDNRTVSYNIYRYLNDLPLAQPSYWGHPDDAVNTDGWINVLNSINGNVWDSAQDSVSSGDWTAFLEFPIVATVSDKVRFMSSIRLGKIDLIDLDIYYNDQWHHLYQGEFLDHEWEEKLLTERQTLTNARVKFHSVEDTIGQVYEFEYHHWYPSVPADYQIPKL